MGTERHGRNLKNYKYYQVSQAIINKIADGEWRAGDKIPPESELCQILNVSRVTLRESLKILSILGVLDIVQGDGTYVREVNPVTFIEPLLPLLHCNRVYTQEIYVSRMIVESGSCELAAKNRTDADVTYLYGLIEDMQEAISIGSIDLYSEADVKFHQRINSICGNEIVHMLCNMFSELVKYYVGKINEDLVAINSSMSDHFKIYEAIRDCRPEFARLMMSEHLRSSLGYLLKK